MRILLDTNIIIHRETARVVRTDIGQLFYWLDKVKADKCVHPATLKEISQHGDPQVVKSFSIKLQSYQQLQVEAPETKEINQIRAKYDTTPNDEIDTSLLKEVFAKRVDFLITEDKKIHIKAKGLGIASRVYTIEAFLEKLVAENPDLVDYRVLSVKKERFGNININDPFFDSFKSDYDGFADWFNRKAENIAYICKGEGGTILAFLYIKLEGEDENYSDIEPRFAPKRRLKIGTFKVIANGFKLGERFLKIVFDNALQFNVQDIYVTIFDRTEEQKKLIELLMKWGFIEHGKKKSSSGEENVYVRDFSPTFNFNSPTLTYPFVSGRTRKFIVPIYPAYHTELLPDSILKTESELEFRSHFKNACRS